MSALWKYAKVGAGSCRAFFKGVDDDDGDPRLLSCRRETHNEGDRVEGQNYKALMASLREKGKGWLWRKLFGEKGK
jgi:hypothetical protein